MATSASVYNYQRTVRQILKRHRKDPASFIVHIHPQFMRFEKQDGCFLFESRTKDFLHYIRDQTLPVDLVDVFEQAGVPFFEGCLMVEVHDHRKPTASAAENSTRSEYGRMDRNNTELMYLRDGGRYGRRTTGALGRPGAPEDTYPGPDGVEIYRVVLQPTVEGVWNDLKAMDAKLGGIWSDEDALRVDAAIVNLTAPPLCLTPDPHAMRIANLMLSSTMPPAYCPHTPSFQRYRREKGTGHKLNSVELELERSQDARREQIMSMMKDGWATTSAPANTTDVGSTDGSFVPTFSRLDFLRNWRKARTGDGAPDANAQPNGKVPEMAKATPPKKKKTAKGKADEKKDESAASPDAASPPQKGRAKAKRRKTEEVASPLEKPAPAPKQKSVLYPGGQLFPGKANAQFPAYNMQADKPMVLPGQGVAMNHNVLPNGAMMPGFGTPTLGMQGLPSAFNSPQQGMQPVEQEGTSWMYS